MRQEKVISPHVIYRKLYNLLLSHVPAIMADNGIRPRAIIRNLDNQLGKHGKLTVLFLPYLFTFGC